MIYLLKSAATSEYLQQNLKILSLPEGSTGPINYARRWIAPDVWEQILPGDPVCIVFGDRPYQHLVPIRHATIAGVEWSSSEVALSVRLGPLVRLRDSQALGPRFMELNRGQYFVVSDNAPPVLDPATGPDLADWKNIVKALVRPTSDGQPSRYSRTIFLRPAAARTIDGESLTEGNALRAGQDYLQPIHCYAPSLAAEEIQRYELVVEPSTPNVAVGVPPALRQDGEVRIAWRAMTSGTVECAVWVKPDRATSTSLQLKYEAAEKAEPVVDETGIKQVEAAISPKPVLLEPVSIAAPSAARPVLGDRDLRAILDSVRLSDTGNRDAGGRAPAALSLIEHTLSPLAPDSHYLKEQRALCLADLGRWLDAYNAFQSCDLDRLPPDSVATWFISACRAEIDTDLGEILRYFTGWDQLALTRRLIDALPSVQEQRRLNLLEDTWLSAGQHEEMWQVVGPSFRDPDRILRAVELMADKDLYALLSPGQVYKYLIERMQALGSRPFVLLQRAVATGLAEPNEAPDLDEFLMELLGQLLARGDEPESAWRLVENARKCVSPHVWALAAEQLADALRSDPSTEWRECAAELYVELARVYRVELNDLDVAADFLASAGQLAGENTELDESVQAEAKAWEESIQLLDGVRKWRDGMLEVRRKELRKHLQGKRAIFVGGLERGFDAEYVRTQLAFGRADFVPHFHTERGKLDTIPPRIRQKQVDYVIDFIAFGAHRNLEGVCKEHDVKYVRVPRGRSLDQIVRALADLHGIVL